MEEIKTFSGDLEAELQEIMGLDSIADENTYSFTANYTEYFTIICC